MTKCNIKTFVAISVLCVFFNGILIYGMQGETGSGKIIQNDNISKEKTKKEINRDIGDTKEFIALEKIKKTPDSIFFNYKGNFSLLCCFNLCNNKKVYQKNYFLEQQKKMYKKTEGSGESLLIEDPKEKNDDRLLSGDYSDEDSLNKEYQQ